MEQKQNAVYAVLLFCTIIWGLNVVMVKYLVGYMEPLQLVAFRIVNATILLFPLVIWKLGIKALIIKKQAIFPILMAGMLCVYLHQACLAYGLLETSSGTGGLILGLNPLMTALLAAFFLKEKLTVSRFIGIVVGFVGVIFVILGNKADFSFSQGDLIMVAAMVSYAVGTLFIITASKHAGALAITFYSHLLAGIMLMITFLFTKPAQVSWFPRVFVEGNINVLIVFFLASWVSTAICNMLWNHSIPKIGASRSAMFFNVLPLSSLIGAVIFLGESITYLHFIALVCIVFGVYMGAKEMRKLKPPIRNT